MPADLSNEEAPLASLYGSVPDLTRGREDVLTMLRTEAENG